MMALTGTFSTTFSTTVVIVMLMVLMTPAFILMTITQVMTMIMPSSVIPTIAHQTKQPESEGLRIMYKIYFEELRS